MRPALGLNRLAERIAVNKEKKSQEKVGVVVKEGFCRNCGSDMKGMDVCARCGYVASLGQMPTEWEEEGQKSPADGNAQEQAPAEDKAVLVQGESGGGQQGELGMKWYKFIIYVQLFLVALANVGTAGMYFGGLSYGEDVEWVYQVYGGLKTLDMSMGMVSLALAVLCIYVWGRMRRFRKNAVPLYLSIFIISLASVIIYNIAWNGIAGVGNEGSMESLGSAVGGRVVWIVFNYRYFKKRRHLFNA